MKRSLVAGVLLLVAPTLAAATGFWLPANDLRLRQDLTLLADEGVIGMLVTTWPLPIEPVRRAVARPRLEDIAEPGLQAALQRVRAAVAVSTGAGEWALREVAVRAGEQGLLRDYGTLARENLELAATGGATTDRWSVNVRGTVALSPQDGRELRLDGSDATLRLGNWLLSINSMDRWYGPGYEGSLILSTNARPMPQLSIDRLESEPFPVPVLRWLGPWRFTMHVGKADSSRPDIRNSLFLGMRASFQPLGIIELGLSRSAQFCGSDYSGLRADCNLGQFARVLVGKDNTGYRGTNEVNEPGNQMAGLDFRIVSPWRALPLAVHGQLIGEDSSGQSRSLVPNRYLGTFGAEAWSLLGDGSTLRGRFEYANTACKWYRPASQPNCAYRQTIFFAGYRYRGRNIGHTADSDSESLSATLDWVRADGERFSARVRRTRLDRRGGVDGFNILTQGPSLHDAVDVGWSGLILGERVAMQVGYESQKGSLGPNRSGPFGFVEWRRAVN